MFFVTCCHAQMHHLWQVFGGGVITGLSRPLKATHCCPNPPEQHKAWDKMTRSSEQRSAALLLHVSAFLIDSFLFFFLSCTLLNPSARPSVPPLSWRCSAHTVSAQSVVWSGQSDAERYEDWVWGFYWQLCTRRQIKIQQQQRRVSLSQVCTQQP